jgi:hypothetical protein
MDKFYIIKNQSIINELLMLSFKNSKFNSTFSETTPFEETMKNTLITDNNRKYFIVFDAHQKIIGGLMGIDTISRFENQDAYCGWFFTVPSLKMRLRKTISIDLIHRTFELARIGGFHRIVTMMGTKAGESFFSKMGFTKQSTEIEENNWVYHL